MNKLEQFFVWLAVHPEWIAGGLVVSIAALIVVGFIGNANQKRHGDHF